MFHLSLFLPKCLFWKSAFTILYNDRVLYLSLCIDYQVVHGFILCVLVLPVYVMLSHCILQIADHLKGSILYLDAGCVESFQILGGFPLLLDHGVNVVCSLENMAALDAVR